MLTKFVTIAFAALLSVGSLAGCVQTQSPQPTAEEKHAAASNLDLKTIGDIYSLQTENTSSTLGNGKFVYVFQTEGTYYRATADVSPEVYDKLIDLDVSADDFEAKSKELTSTLQITNLENLSTGIPTPDELTKYAGKTGQDMLDEGFVVSGYTTTDRDITFFADKGDYEYSIVCEWTDAVDQFIEQTDEAAEAEPADGDIAITDAPAEEPYVTLFRELKVVSVEFSAISWNATNVN